jgi:hypothetical protein
LLFGRRRRTLEFRPLDAVTTMTTSARPYFLVFAPSHRVVILSVTLSILLLAATLFPLLLFPLLVLLALDLALGPGAWVCAPARAVAHRGSPLRQSERGPPRV